jgi:hypothetical protein
MGNLVSTWDDTENNRRVELAICYQLESGHVELTSVTPTKVTFAETKRSLRVWTAGGRELLARQAEQAGWLHMVREKVGAGELHSIAHHTTAVDEHAFDLSLEASA